MRGGIRRTIGASFYFAVSLRRIYSHQQHPPTMNLLTHNLLCCPLAAAVQKLPLVIEATEVTTKERDFNLDFLKKYEALPLTVLFVSPPHNLQRHWACRMARSASGCRRLVSSGCVAPFRLNLTTRGSAPRIPRARSALFIHHTHQTSLQVVTASRSACNRGGG